MNQENPQNPQNPYETPQTEGINTNHFSADHDMELASRWARLGGAIIDSLLLGVISMAIFIPLGLISFDPNKPANLVATLFTFIISFILFVLLQGYFLKNEGKTIGKKLLGMKIVTMDGELPDFLPLIGKRYAVFWVASMIPFIGGLISLVNALFIFREDKRCLHDLLAGTQVVKD
ncbi:RDD family protein [Ostreibacterium oceani]|uniref:RDD family protein n=1 Tax=Ostreibacterium oceani TaxID=2654998 RepID=A0A6N7ES30_9GAMM|nr:RDD family protein [Ostreibacterium oceani]MPV85302.1 RDD family protein [Ostreibacterium oceani]